MIVLRKLLIASDIGGSDADDKQSLIHALQHSSLYDLRGVIVGAPGGKLKAAKNIYMAYERDFFDYSLGGKGFISPELLHAITSAGVQYEDERWKPNAGVAKIIFEAQRATRTDPLIVVSWGAATDIATAIYLEPSIATNIILYFIGSYNRTKDLESFNYLMKKCPYLRMIWCETSFRGMYLGGFGNGPLSNRGFVRGEIEPRGALGQAFWRASKYINVNSYGIKMGDTPSLLWALSSQDLDPTKPSLGGQFVRIPGTRKFTDSKAPGRRIGIYNGAQTVARHRRQILTLWRNQLKEMYGEL